MFRNGAAQRLKAGGPKVWLILRLSLAFVMALHELPTNAVKYGALSNNRSRLILNWAIVGGSTPERLWLR
ncbi:hypothetical protein [Methylobacterium gnaphalii]|uniref:Uncharacterized protein n=1 Tax=Methylobacterium gnaphalii TaxID=1010610 RepID=A0A512JQU1_9HYPH|nr:hypothetical protein [Methylobacterium gnaphalii]GEP12301.1 hypothetical protein MGN01_41460 [Methylobacterium gnaphalii]GJD70916.1 Blue-light-activated histidine kinase 1 [Methylobacterium gnaphalii]GLS50917.1 hypothetical protein GCM10007885_37710 [Methylobacterium gnaphalii]